jgi:hypothetical protein
MAAVHEIIKDEQTEYHALQDDFIKICEYVGVTVHRLSAEAYTLPSIVLEINTNPCNSFNRPLNAFLKDLIKGSDYPIFYEDAGNERWQAVEHAIKKIDKTFDIVACTELLDVLNEYAYYFLALMTDWLELHGEVDFLSGHAENLGMLFFCDGTPFLDEYSNHK